MDDGNPIGDHATVEMDEAIEQACQTGYAAGLIDGQEEGLNTAQSALAPGLENFAGAYDNMVALIPGMADIMGTQVVQLTHVLVERVLGKEIQLAKPDLNNLHPSIVETIYHSHRLMIRIHPKDARDIEVLAKALNLSCPDGCEVVAFTRDSDQTPGQLSMEMEEHYIPGDVNELADLLSGVTRNQPDPSPGKQA